MKGITIGKLKSETTKAANRSGLRGQANKDAQKNLDKTDKKLDAIEKKAKGK